MSSVTNFAIDPGANPKRLSRLPWREVDGRMVVIQPQKGEVHELNGVGAFLWTQLDGSFSILQIAENVSNQFEVSSEIASLDVSAFVEQLSSLGLLEPGSSN